MRKFILITSTLLIVLLSGCASKHAILNQNYETRQVIIPGKLVGINIIDQRQEVTTEKIKLPTISFPGKVNKVSPELTSEQEQLITNQIKSYFTNNDRALSVNCYIIEGFQEFSAHTFYEREYVQCDVKIELTDQSNDILKYCTSSFFIEAKSVDATYAYMNKIYEKAIRTSIYKCFEKLDD